MEGLQEALKTSFVPVVKATHNGVSDDDFFVDNLLDFSKDYPDEETEQKNEDNNGASFNILPPSQKEDSKIHHHTNTNTNTFSVNEDSGSIPESELCVPADDIADLEWLSNFVDDSFTGYSLTIPPGKKFEKPSEPAVPVLEKPCFTTPVQTKARSKRVRNGGRIWTLGSPALTESSASSSSSSSCTSSPSPWLMYTSDSVLGKAPVKKQRKSEGSAGGGPQPRRCSHCLVQKTPQWRTGPLGAKTLCNACGVRYKSGRLLPEYRPACSPTFSSEVHSNNHRKVLEMRRKKEVELETGSGHPVQSC